MVLIAKKQIEQTVLLNDVENVSILGLDQGWILLFSAISSSLTRSSNIPRTIIGGVQLNDGEQKIYHRHPSCVKITHASINAARSLICFVTRAESHEVFVAEIGLPNSGRLFSLKFSRPGPIRAFLAPHDVILLLYKDTVTVFRMPNSGHTANKSVALDRDAQLNECVYYQWDTLQQRLHVIQKRPPVLIKTPLKPGYEAFIYTAYTINGRGQFDSIMKIDFDLKVPPLSTSFENFEIISSDSSLFLCWQLIMKEETERAEYAIVSLGHGRTLHISKSLNRGNSEIFKSRKIHFGLLDGDYVFAILRGEFTHLLDFNVQLGFFNHLFFPNDPNSLPYDTKYTTQRGLLNKSLTLIYEKKNLFTYTIEIGPNELMKSLSSTTIQSIISYVLVASKDSNIIQEILKKILFEMYDDLNTKTYLMEILTALIFIRLAKRTHHNKYVLGFPATTMKNNHSNDTDVITRFEWHHRECQPERSGTTNLDQEYHEKLRTSFTYSRRYRHKISYSHQTITSMDEPEVMNEFNPNRRPPIPLPTNDRRPPSPRFFNFGRRSDPLPVNPNTNDNLRSPLLLNKKNALLFQSVSDGLNDYHSDWGQDRIANIASEYVQATQSQCDYLIKSFTRLAKFDRARGLIDDDDDPEPASEKYKTLLVVIEKLYLAMVDLGFSPTDDLQRTLLEISFRVMPFDRFIAAIDQNILTLTQDFVQKVIEELDNDDPKSYLIKEQLILMLPNADSELQSSLFDLIKDNRAKRMSAQLHVVRSFSTDKRNKSTTTYDSGDPSDESKIELIFQVQVDEIGNVNSNANGTNTHSRLVEQAIVTFYRDCFERNSLDRDEMRTVKAGLLTLVSSTP